MQLGLLERVDRMMNFVRDFWVDMFPLFQNGYEFVYIFLELATIGVLFTIMFEVPAKIFFGKKGGFFKWD